MKATTYRLGWVNVRELRTERGGREAEKTIRKWKLAGKRSGVQGRKNPGNNERRMPTVLLVKKQAWN